MPDVAFVRELAAIPIATVAMYFMYKIATNHVNSLAEAVSKLADAVGDLKEWLIREKSHD